MQSFCQMNVDNISHFGPFMDKYYKLMVQENTNIKIGLFFISLDSSSVHVLLFLLFFSSSSLLSLLSSLLDSMLFLLSSGFLHLTKWHRVKPLIFGQRISPSLQKHNLNKLIGCAHLQVVWIMFGLMPHMHFLKLFPWQRQSTAQESLLSSSFELGTIAI